MERVSCQLLDKSNYRTWYKQLESILIANGIDSTISKEYEKGRSPTSDERKMQGKALYYIRSSISTQDQLLIINCDTAKEALDTIKISYTKSENLYNLNKELERIKWGIDPVEVFISKINDIRLRMKNLSGTAPIEDNLFINKINEQMPKFMSHIQANYQIKLWDGDSIDYDKYTSTITSAYHNILDKKEDDKKDKQIAYYANTSTTSTFCNICKSTGHTRIQCSRYDPNYRKNRRPRYTRYDKVSNQAKASTDKQEPSKDSTASSTDNGATKSDQNKKFVATYRDAAFCNSMSSSKSTDFCLDSCATRHIVNDLKFFTSFKEFKEPQQLNGIGTGSALGVGQVAVISKVRNKRIPFNLADVLFIPAVPINLVSQIQLENNGIRFSKSESSEYLYLHGSINNDTIMTARRNKESNDFYTLNITVNNTSAYLADTEWHRRLGHTNYSYIYNTAKHVTGMEIDKSSNNKDTCRPCVLAKSTRRSYNHKLIKSTIAGEVIHTDICNLPTTSIGGNKYFIIFIDEFSRYIKVYFLKTIDKESVVKCVNNYLAHQNYMIRSKPTRIHADKGGSYTSDLLNDLLKDPKYSIELTTATTANHEQNGLAEKSIQDVMNMARSFLFDSEMPERLWAEAVANAAYIKNRTYRNAIKKTPHEAFTSNIPDISHIKTFGTKALVHIQEKDLHKTRHRSIDMRLVGHSDYTTVVYRLVNRDYTRIIEASNVYFDEKICPESSVIINSPTSIFEDQPNTSADQEIESNDKESENESEQISNVSTNNLLTSDSSFSDNTAIDTTDNIVHQTYDFQLPKKDIKIPTSVNEMLNSPQAELWLEACDDQFLQYINHNAYELVERPPGVKILRGHWRFTVKTDESDIITKFKSRYVVDGSNMNIDTSYSPVINSTILRLMLSIACNRKWNIHLVDVKSAYLNSLINEDVYMYQIPLYVDPLRPNYVCKFIKSTYGLPMSAYNWYITITEYLHSVGFEQSRIEPCLYHLSNHMLYVLVYVDDIIIISPDIDLMNVFKQSINTKFGISDHNQIQSCLGIDYHYNKETGVLDMTQIRKIEDLHTKHLNYLPKATKLPLQSNTNMLEESPPLDDVFLYQSIIGSLNYIALSTRLDISMYIGQLSKYLKAPKLIHLQLAYKIISYLYQTRYLVLRFKSNPDSIKSIQIYTDASNFNIECNKYATSGVVSILFGNIVSWSSKKQTAVTGEICESELYAINSGLKHGLYLRNVLKEINLSYLIDDQLIIKSDNSSAIEISKAGFKNNSKHYNTVLLYVKDFIERNEVKVIKVNSSENIADWFTKFVSHSQFKTLIGLSNLKRKLTATTDNN